MTEQTWRARIVVMLKPVVNDPQGLAIGDGLRQMGYASVAEVRAGKYFEISLVAADRNAAERQVQEMCTRLLANPVIEEFRFTLVRSRRASPRVARAAG